MARQPRLAVAGQAHVLVQRAVHGERLAHDDTDRLALRDAIDEAARAQRVTLWGYALADDALHLLATPPQADALGRMMQSVGRRYVAGFNRRHGRAGTLWAGRFHAAVVEAGAPLLAALVGVDALLPPDSAWSSAAHHLGLRRDRLLADPPELWALGNTPFEREAGYRACLEQGPDPVWHDRIARAMRGGWAVGSPAFVAAVAHEAGRAAAPKRRGRPPKEEPAGPNLA